MKLNILPEKLIGPKYVLFVEYENCFTCTLEFNELTEEKDGIKVEKYIKVLQEIEKKYKTSEGIYCYLDEKLDSMFSEDHEMYDFLLGQNFILYTIGDCAIAYTGFYIKYLDEEGFWHNIEIEDNI